VVVNAVTNTGGFCRDIAMNQPLFISSVDLVDLEEVIYEEHFTRALQDHDSGGASTPVCGVENPTPRTNLETENSSLWYYYWHSCWSYVRTPILLKGKTEKS
jgi:hypothetical protein